jgi:thiamine-monophosphate kinase
LPKTFKHEWVERFATRLRSLAETYQIALAGGDTTAGETLTVTISVHGTSPHPVLRSGAVAGDDIWVTGELGLAAAALPFVLHQTDQRPPEKWLDAYWQPLPPVHFAASLEGCIHSAIDLSDGLVGDANHIAQRSQKTLNLSIDALMAESDLNAFGETGRQYVTAGGDDYQLLFTASKLARREIEALAQEHQVKVTHIGEVEEGKAQVCWYDSGRLIDLPWQSFTHF